MLTRHYPFTLDAPPPTEMINGDQKPYSFEVDWWSAAVTFYNLLTGVMGLGQPNCRKERVEDSAGGAGLWW